MRRVAPLTVLLGLAMCGLGLEPTRAQEQPAAAEDPQDLLSRARSARHRAERDSREQGLRAARLLFERVVDQHPGSRWAAEALFELSDTRRSYRSESVSPLPYLRRLQQDHPTYRPREVQKRLSRFVSWRFSPVPDVVAADAERLELRPHWNLSAELRLYRVPDAALRAALLAGTDQPAHEVVPRSAWELIDRRAVAAASNASRDLTPPTLALPLGVSAFVLEEQVDGFTRRHSFTRRSFHLQVEVVGSDLVAYAFDRETGAPTPGVSIELAREGAEAAHATTDSDGLARLGCTPGPLLVLARRGSELAHAALWVEETPPRALVLVTTDRPLYRPGQTVHFKALRRELVGGRPRRGDWAPVTVEVRDPKGRVLQREERSWSAHGTLSGTFTLATEPPLGSYAVLVHVPGTGPPGWPSWAHGWGGEVPDASARGFRVAAYRKPDVRVGVQVTSDAARLGAEVQAELTAETFFDAPLAGAEVTWTVTEWSRWRSDEPGPRAPDAPLDDPAEWVLEEGGEEGRDWGWSGAEVASGSGVTDAEGKLTLSFPTQEGPRPRDYDVHVSLTDLTRFEVETRERLTIAPQGADLQVGADRTFVSQGEAVDALVCLADWNGVPLAGRTVELTAFVSERPFAEDGLELEAFTRALLVTDLQGRASAPVTPPCSGWLRLRVRLRPAEPPAASSTASGPVTARAELWVAGPNALAPTDSYSELWVQVLADRRAYAAGEVAQLLIRTSHAPARALLTVAGAGLHQARPLLLEQRWQVVELSLPEAWAPAVDVRVSVWHGEQAVTQRVRLGVAPAVSRLEVRVEPDRARYRPGETARLVLHTRRDGAPVAGEVELVAVDARVLALAPDETPDLRTYFHRISLPESLLAGTLVAYGPGSSTSDGDDGGAGGVLSFEDAEEPQPAVGVDALAGPTSTRRWFPDTLLYCAHVQTDADGRAEVELPLADALTTWRVVARAVAGDDGFGQASVDLVTEQPVSLRLSAPRFYVAGDRGAVATVVRNDTADAARFVVRLEADGLEVEAPAPRALEVPAHGEARLDWWVRAERPGTATLRAEARSAAGADAVERSLPVQVHGIERREHRAGSASPRWTTSLTVPDEAARAGARLEVAVAAGPSAAILQALPFLAGYPYGCVEQTLSRFLPAVVAAAALRRLGAPNPALEAALPDMVGAGLQRLYRFQHDDGGWGWWEHDETDERMTAYVLEGLVAARDAGFLVDEGAIARGCAALEKIARTPYALFALTRAGVAAGVDVQERLARASPWTPDDRCYLVLAGRLDLAEHLPTPPATLKTGDEVHGAALLLRALRAQAQAEAAPPEAGAGPVSTPAIEALVATLLEARRGAAWASTLDTAHAVMALCELATPPTPSGYTLRVNGVALSAEGPAGDERLGGPGRLLVGPACLRVGANQIEVESAGDARLSVSVALTYPDVREDLPSSQGSVRVWRALERAERGADGEVTWKTLPEPVTVRIGDEVRLVIEVDLLEDQRYVLLEAPLLAGSEGHMELEEDLWGSWYQRREVRDDRVGVCARVLRDRDRVELPLRLTHPGEYHMLPARFVPMYDPDGAATSPELRVVVVE